jgi:UDP-2,3-diacylglucosamine hydrolase
MDLLAPSRWRQIDLLSDIHLDVREPDTYALWSNYLRGTSADAIFILGDLFEVWVGDDVLEQPDRFESQCVSDLSAAGSRLDLRIMTGNRDFLMGQQLLARCNANTLPDPTTLVFGQQRIVLSHGDALCLDDTDYQSFRRVVRSQSWQQNFLSKPFSQREAIAREIREQSASKQHAAPESGHADVDARAALDLLSAQESATLIHGHTHRPGETQLGSGKKRLVLSDWVANATPPRADIIRLTLSDDSGLHISRTSLV